MRAQSDGLLIRQWGQWLRFWRGKFTDMVLGLSIETEKIISRRLIHHQRVGFPCVCIERVAANRRT